MLDVIIQPYIELQEFINANSFAGIPLDILAHFFVSALITILLLKLKVRFKFTFFIILLIAILKEILDWHRQVSPEVLESAKDILVTLLYPIIIYKIADRKKKLSKK